MLIKETKIDLRSLDLGFDSLNGQQVEALNNLAEFVQKDGASATVLSGSAGTGKSSIVKILIEYINTVQPRTSIQMATPTHKAKAVLNSLTGQNSAVTLHKLLKLKPNLDIEDFDVRDLEFHMDIVLEFFNYNTIYIIDECSMINDALYDLIISKLAKGGDKVIFIGDAAQLSPVKQDTLSKCFVDVDYPGYILTEVMRQVENNPLTKVLVGLRNSSRRGFESEISEDSGVICHEDSKSFAIAMQKSIAGTNYAKTPYKNKVMAYTNNRVDQLNTFIRSKILKFTKPVERGDLLIGNDSYRRGNIPDPIIHNGSDYVVLNMDPTIKNITYCGNIPGYNVRLYDTVEKFQFTVFLVDPEADQSIYDHLGEMQEGIRLSAIAKGISGWERKKLWSAFYEILESYVTFRPIINRGRHIRNATFRHGYAITVHKSQGSSYDSVFVDMTDVMTCRDPILTRQLQYVSLSRARNYAHIL